MNLLKTLFMVWILISVLVHVVLDFWCHLPPCIYRWRWAWDIVTNYDMNSSCHSSSLRHSDCVSRNKSKAGTLHLNTHTYRHKYTYLSVWQCTRNFSVESISKNKNQWRIKGTVPFCLVYCTLIFLSHSVTSFFFLSHTPIPHSFCFIVHFLPLWYCSVPTHVHTKVDRSQPDVLPQWIFAPYILPHHFYIQGLSQNKSQVKN